MQATRHDFSVNTSWSGESVDAHDKTNTARLSEAFRALDRDGDGVLSLAEFTPLAKTMGADGDDAVQEMFNELDTDSNGVISEGKFLAFFRHAFGEDDLDGLGEEAREGMQRLLQMFCMLKDPCGCTMSMHQASESNAIDRINSLKRIQRRTGTLEWLPMSRGDTSPTAPITLDAPLIPNAPPSHDERNLIRALQALTDIIRALKDTVSYLRSDSTDPTTFVDPLSYRGAGAEATNVMEEMLAEIEALKSRNAVMKKALQMTKEDVKRFSEQISEQKAELARRAQAEGDLKTQLAEILEQLAQKQREAEEAYDQEKKTKAWAQNLEALVNGLQLDLDARAQNDQHIKDLLLEVDAIRDMHEEEMEKMWRETQQLIAQKDKEMERVLQEVMERMEAVRKARMAPWAVITDQALRRADPSFPDLATQKGREQHEDAQLFLLQLLQYTFGTRYGNLCYSEHQSAHYFDDTKRLDGEPCCVGTVLLQKIHELIPPTPEDAKQRPSDKFSVLAKNMPLLHEALTASQGPPR